MSDINSDFYKLSKALKRAGETGLRNKLSKGLRDAAKPVIADVKDAFERDLPHKGGLGAFVAGKKATVVTLTGRDPGVQIRIAKQDPRMEASGRLVHPVFGRRAKGETRTRTRTRGGANPVTATSQRVGKRITVVQHVKPGIVAAQLDKSAPKVQHQLEQVIQDMYREVIREVGH